VDAPVSHEVSTVRTPIHQFVEHPLLQIIELFELCVEIDVDRPIGEAWCVFSHLIQALGFVLYPLYQ
jgi:hypothetical protein